MGGYPYLFIEYSATTGGGKRILSYILKYAPPGKEAVVLLDKGGPLVSEFNECARVYVLDYYSMPAGLEKVSNALARFEHRVKVLRTVRRIICRIRAQYKLRVADRVLKSVDPRMVIRCHSNYDEVLSKLDLGKCGVVQHLMQPAMSLYRKKEWELKSLLSADAYICEGQGMERVATDYLNIDPERIKLSCIGVDPKRESSETCDGSEDIETHIRDEEFVIMTCGSLIYSKGVDIWVRAAIRVLDACPQSQIKFICVGGRRKDFNTIYGKALSKIVKNSLHEDRIKFVGYRPNVFPWLHRCDLFVQPSRDDAFPHAIMEAMAVEKPTICFPVGIGLEDYAKDAVHVVDRISDKALADGIIQLFTDEQRRRHLASNGASLMRSAFDVQQTVSTYWRQLDESASVSALAD